MKQVISVIVFVLLAMIASSAFSAVGYKLSAGDGSTSGGSGATPITSPGELKHWDEQRLKTGEAVGKAAVAKTGKSSAELSMADLKKKDEENIKKVEAAQAKKKARFAELTAKAKKMIEKKPPPSVVGSVADTVIDMGNGKGRDIVLEWALGPVAGSIVGVALDLLELPNGPDPTDPFDLPKNKEEMKKLREFLEQHEKEQKSIDATKPSNPSTPNNTLDSNFDALRTPAAQAETAFKREIIISIKAKSDDAAYIAEKVIVSTLPESKSSIDHGVIKELQKRLWKILPANICFISKNDVCTLNGYNQGEKCMCPQLTPLGYDTMFWANGTSSYRKISSVCVSPVGRCQMNEAGPIGTPCFCYPDTPWVGSIPIGKIVRGPY